MSPDTIIARMKCCVVTMKALDAQGKLAALKRMMKHDPVLNELFDEWEYGAGTAVRGHRIPSSRGT